MFTEKVTIKQVTEESDSFKQHFISDIMQIENTRP